MAAPRLILKGRQGFFAELLTTRVTIASTILRFYHLAQSYVEMLAQQRRIAERTMDRDGPVMDPPRAHLAST